MQQIETGRLILRRITPGDAAFIVALYEQPAFVRFVGDRGLKTAAQAEAYIIQGPLKSFGRFGFGTWVAELKETHEPVGTGGLYKRDDFEDVDIGYALLPQFWSKGYAREIAAAVLAYAQAVLKFPRVAAIVSPENERSIRVLESIGLRYEKTICWPKDGSELNYFAIGEPVGNCVALRDVLEEDLPVFFEQQLDPQANFMAAFTAKDPQDREAFDRHWARIMTDPTVIIKTALRNGLVLGSVLSYEDEGHPEVSYWLGKEYWGQGLATQALRAFLEQGNQTRPIYARVAKDNLASRRVLEKCGFVQVEVTRGFANARDQEIEEVLMVLNA
jgi:RimJ/RimL family protein N-acetyltransferase